MSTLQQILKSKLEESVAAYKPKSQGEQKFVQKHFDIDNRPQMAPGFEGDKDRAGNSLNLYRGVTKPAPRPGHGYAAAPSDEDEKVYESKTHKHQDNSKHQNRKSVKQFLKKKKDRDDKRMQEDIDIPENESVVEIVDGIQEGTATNTDVRALKGKITHAVFVGIVGTAPEQTHYRIQDSGGRQHHIFTNKKLGNKGDMVDLPVKEYKKGGGLLSVAKKNALKEEFELSEARVPGSHGTRPKHDPNNPTDVHGVYLQHHEECKSLLAQISQGLEKHKTDATKPKEVIGHKPGTGVYTKKVPSTHWGHVGDLKSHKATLENMRDQLMQRGEYHPDNVAKLDSPYRREEVTVEEAFDDAKDDIHAIRRKMMAANAVHIEGIKHKDKGMQEAARKRLAQLAKAHSQLSAHEDIEYDDEFAAVADEINELVAEEMTARFVEGVGEEFVIKITTAMEHLDDDSLATVAQLIQNEQWDKLKEVFSDEVETA